MRYPESYRLRVVSISCDPAYVFSIDGHQLSIIEVDGINVQPLQVDSLEIFAGMESRTSFTRCLLMPSNRSTLFRCCKMK
jgi:FtsP/CotA-like multicopper oxidase with cupredoxin domain